MKLSTFRLFGGMVGAVNAVQLFVFLVALDLPMTITCFARAQESSDTSRVSQFSYENLLKLKHAEQLRAAKSILSLGDYAKQHQMLTMIYQKMFKIVSEAKLVIESSGYVHGEDFPANTTVRDALSTTVENALFFGNILLRLPDITHKILANKKEWRLTLQWSWQLCNELHLLDDQMRTVLDLAGQELGFIEKDPDYVNPYKAENQKEKAASNIMGKQTEPAKKKKKRTARSKGPQMSGSNYGDL